MRPWSFYEHWLGLVSRSFAVCIPQLDPPFRDRIALAYLLFRVLDTIEDTRFNDPATQQRQFERLRAFLRMMPAQHRVDAFVEAFPTNITAAERSLLEQTHALLAEGHELPATDRAIVFGALDRMALGMQSYTRRAEPLRLLDVEDVARYCCFVAGVVGEMLTELWTVDRNLPAPRTALAYQFGLYLQKVNILKDQQEDEAAGRFFVPDRPALLASVRKDAQGALAYLQALPRGDRYRVFCAWSLMLGAVTIAQLDQPKRSRRAETAELLARTAAIADDNAALMQQFGELLPPLPDRVEHPPVPKPESFEWFRHTLAAPLTDSELRELGVGTARPTTRAIIAAS